MVQPVHLYYSKTDLLDFKSPYFVVLDKWKFFSECYVVVKLQETMMISAVKFVVVKVSCCCCCFGQIRFDLVDGKPRDRLRHIYMNR